MAEDEPDVTAVGLVGDIENIADAGYEASQEVQSDIPGHPSNEALRHAEPVCLTNYVAGDRGSDGIAEAWEEAARTEERQSGLQSLIRTPYAVLCLIKKQ